MGVLKRAEFIEHVNAHNIGPHVEAALARAEALSAELAGPKAKGTCNDHA